MLVPTHRDNSYRHFAWCPRQDIDTHKLHKVSDECVTHRRGMMMGTRRRATHVTTRLTYGCPRRQYQEYLSVNLQHTTPRWRVVRDVSTILNILSHIPEGWDRRDACLRHRHWPFAGVSLFLSLHGEKIVIFASKDGSAQRAQRTLRMWTTSAWVPRAHARGGDVTCQSDTP